MTQQATTQENINKLIEFRQAIYEHGLQARKDALFDVLDALLSTGSVSSFAMLSQSERFQRKWPSLYAGVEDGQLNSAWLRSFLGQQVPSAGICIFPLDGSSWQRPRARTLEDRQYIYQASTDVNGGTVTIGYPYSPLEWCVEPHSSWSLPVDVRQQLVIFHIPHHFMAITDGLCIAQGCVKKWLEVIVLLGCRDRVYHLIQI